MTDKTGATLYGGKRTAVPFSLIIVISFILSFSSFAQDIPDTNVDLKWANDLSDSASQAVWENLSKQFNEQEYIQGADIASQSTSKLYVFVSSSMPLPLLKGYASEAIKYDATLVFKGLPNGSFKELAELIAQLKDDKPRDSEETSVNAVIDDESFDKFDVSSVPTIILTQEPPYHPNQTPYIKFDKITGNIGIKYALEQFEASGELAKEAAKRLKEPKDD